MDNLQWDCCEFCVFWLNQLVDNNVVPLAALQVCLCCAPMPGPVLLVRIDNWLVSSHHWENTCATSLTEHSICVEIVCLLLWLYSGNMATWWTDDVYKVWLCAPKYAACTYSSLQRNQNNARRRKRPCGICPPSYEICVKTRVLVIALYTVSIISSKSEWNSGTGMLIGQDESEHAIPLRIQLDQPFKQNYSCGSLKVLVHV